MARSRIDMTANQRTCLMAGGQSPTTLNIIEFVTITTAGNAQDFGDLTTARSQGTATSDSHGGLGGY